MSPASGWTFQPYNIVQRKIERARNAETNLAKSVKTPWHTNLPLTMLIEPRSNIQPCSEGEVAKGFVTLDLDVITSPGDGWVNYHQRTDGRSLHSWVSWSLPTTYQPYQPSPRAQLLVSLLQSQGLLPKWINRKSLPILTQTHWFPSSPLDSSSSQTSASLFL